MQNTVCPHCGTKLSTGHTVTCGDSYCSEANYHEVRAYTARRGSAKQKFHLEEKARILKVIEENRVRDAALK